MATPDPVDVRVDVRHMRRLLDAVLAVGSELSLPVVLRRITEVAMELVDATYGALGVLDPSGSRLQEFVVVGLDARQADRIGHLPEGHGILGLLIVDPRPLRLRDIGAHPESFGTPPNHPQMTSFLGVPIRIRDRVFGNLYLTDKIGHDEFTAVDEELVVALAAAAALAVDNARLNATARAVALLAERERIARDLHDDVIQRVFAVGLSLQAAAQLCTEPVVERRIGQAIDDLDVTIRSVRSTIFELHDDRPSSAGLGDDITSVCRDAARALGFSPRCRVDGPVDEIPHELGQQLVLTLREALSNVARHAHARSVDVFVVADPARVTLRVEDDGVGIGGSADQGGGGIANMGERAQALGGSFSVGQRQGGGTAVAWRAPV